MTANAEEEARRIVKQLLAAGYRPTVYHNVAPPPFLNRGSEVLEVFDPFNFYSPALSPRQDAPPGVHARPCWMLAATRSSESTHQLNTEMAAGCC
jgi:hypothetical protein